MDDNAELLELLLKILTREGYNRLFPAKNCREARELFENEQPDFMILDVNLPDGDGFHLFMEFRAKEDVPALFLSARDDDTGVNVTKDDHIMTLSTCSTTGKRFVVHAVRIGEHALEK